MILASHKQLPDTLFSNEYFKKNYDNLNSIREINLNLPAFEISGKAKDKIERVQTSLSSFRESI